jgi:hypothetical protein
MKLGLTSSTLAKTSDIFAGGSLTCYWGVDVAVRHADGSETPLGSKVAQVSRSVDGIGLQSATWVCPLTSLVSTDAVVVRVYMKIGTGAWQLVMSFITEQLGASQLNNVTWTVYYYTQRSYTPPPDDLTDALYMWGTSSYDDKITNFTWTPAVLAIASKRLLVGVGL